jgi:putative ABC transport system permease protein
LEWGNDGDTLYFVKVVGVVKDFHFASFKNEIKPFVFFNMPNRYDYLTLKLSGQDVFATIQQIEAKWKSFSPDRPFQYFFLDETFSQLYKAEANFQKVFIVLVVLSILISCLGLFGLAAFTAEQRTKEIGIRKVLGASVTRITTMLSADFLKLVFMSIIVATPLAWWAMSKWLQDYAYRIHISWWIFLVAGSLSILIAVVTISFQAIKAALANPVKSLRTE